MSELFLTRERQITKFNAFYTILLIFWALFQITGILSYSTSIMEYTLIPTIVLLSLYALLWVIGLFGGRMLGLNVIGYVGAGIMLLSSLYRLVITSYPVHQMLIDNYGFEHGATIISILSIISIIVNVVGIFMFLAGSRASWLTTIVTPFYFIVSLVINFILPLIISALGAPFTLISAISSSFMLFYIIIIMLPVFLLTRRRA